MARLVDASRIDRQTALLCAKPQPAGSSADAGVARLVEERLARTGLKTWDAVFEAKSVRRPLRNLFALLPGRASDARPVLVGTRYDTADPESADSASATAVLLETAEVLAAIGSGGWKPERTILFAFWDGGEAGFPGSEAFVEQALRDRTPLPIAYVDVDSAVKGKEILAKATPGLRGVLGEALRAVSDPTAQQPLEEGEVAFPLPGFAGTAVPFLALTATPVAQLGSAPPPLLARALALFAGTMASDPVVPYRFTEIAEDSRSALRSLEARAASANDWVGTLPGLEKALDGFEEGAKRWDAGRPRLRRLSPRKAEAANRILERAMDAFGPPAGPSVLWGRGSFLVGPEPGDESLAAVHASLARALLSRNFDRIREEALERTNAFSQAQELLRAAEWIALGPGKPVRSARATRP